MGKNMVNNYKPAKLLKEKSGVWRVCWYNTNPVTGRLERVRQTFDLNRIKNLRERAVAAQQVVEGVNGALQCGFNAFISNEENEALMYREGKSSGRIAQAEIAVQPGSIAFSGSADQAQPEMTIAAAMEAALKIRVLGKSKRTADSYRSMAGTFVAWLQGSGRGGLGVGGMTAGLFREYLFAKAAQGHGNGNLNEHLNFHKTTWGVIRTEIKAVAVNPLTDMAYLPEAESVKFAALTADEIGRIVPVLIAHNPRFYLFTKFIAHEFIRPWHVARLRARDINYGAGEITLSGETTKNKKAVVKQLFTEVRDLLIGLGYDKLPGGYYLFSNTNYEPGQALHESLSNRAAELWKKLVIDGLGVDKKMYALKATGAQYLVNANAQVDVYTLRGLMEHHSAAMTEVYLQKNVKKRFAEKEVKRLEF